MTTTLPVKRMILYKHGVGFIERCAAFSGTEPLKLKFKHDEMDDILKSLSIFDRGKGRVTGVSYETAEDVTELLADRAITLPDGEALIGLFRQLKGYEIMLWTAGEALEGKVLGTDEQEICSPEGEVVEEKHRVVLMTADKKIHSINLNSIVHFEVRTPEAKEDLEFYLDAVTSERKKNVKNVTVFLDGEEHDVAVNYIMSMPSWRVSYRLAYGEETSILQGWGIIDNKLDEDLKAIRLSLVAGKPISFIYDIYAPRYVSRPVVREEARVVSAPVELEGSMEELADLKLVAYDQDQAEQPPITATCTNGFAVDGDIGGAGEAGTRGLLMDIVDQPRATAGKAFAEPPAPDKVRRQLAKAARVQTKTVEMGEFFKYDIETPVTVKRGQSAMVPIIQCPIKCTKEHVYNSQKLPRNPVVTLRVNNDAGVVLERGPIIVLDEGTYVGEAILPYTPVEGENHIAYSVDLGVVVNEKYDSGSKLDVISIKERYFRKQFLEWQTCEYELQNKKPEAIQLILEHPKSGYHLDDETQEPTEETENFYRWKFEMASKSTSKFKLREEKTTYYSEEIRAIGLDTLKYYFENDYISKEDFGTVKAIIDLQKAVEKLEYQNRNLDAEAAVIYQEQDRLRDNLGALGQSTREEKLRVRYVDLLDEQETRLAEILDVKKKNEKEIERLNGDVEKKLKAME